MPANPLVTPTSNPQTASTQSMVNSDLAAAQTQTNSLNNSLLNLQGQQAQNSAAYPAYPNQYGLGGQGTVAPGGTSSTGQPVTVNVPDTSSRGFNPWSLTGEANSRGK